MSDPNLENVETPVEPVAPVETQTPAESKPAEPDPIKEALKAAQEALKATQQSQLSWQELARQNQIRAQEEARQAYRPPVDPLDDEDLDPEVKKALAKVLPKVVDAKLGEFAQQLGSVYQRDQQLAQQRFAAIERERTRTVYGEVYNEYAKDVEEYMASVPDHLRSVPGVYDEALAVVVGRRALQERAQKRAPAVATASRPAPPTPSVPSSEVAEWSARLGIEITEADLKKYGAR